MCVATQTRSRSHFYIGRGLYLAGDFQAAAHRTNVPAGDNKDKNNLILLKLLLRFRFMSIMVVRNRQSLRPVLQQALIPNCSDADARKLILKMLGYSLKRKLKKAMLEIYFHDTGNPGRKLDR